MSWETAKLGEVCTIEKGNIGIMKAIPGEYPLVVLGEERKTHNEFQFDDEAVIVPLVSSTGHGHRSMKRIFFQTGKFSVGSILCAVIPKDRTQLSAEFLYRYLDLNKENELVARMKGMANVSLPMKEIAEVEIPLPPLEVQQGFIEKFQKLESVKNQISTELNHQLALVKELRQAYLREAMQGKLARQDSTDEPAEILLEKIKAEKYDRLSACRNDGKHDRLTARRTKDKPLPPIKPEEIPFEIPSNWSWCRLGDISKQITDGEHQTPPRISEGRMLLSAKNIRNGFIDYSNVDFISEEDYQKSIKRCKPEKGDVLVVSVGATIGRSTILNDSKDFAIVRSVALIKPFLLAFSKFFKFVLDSPILQKEISGRKWGTAQPCLYLNQIKELTIPLPPLAEQERIVAKLEKLMKFCDELEANIRQGIANADRLLKTALKEALEPKDNQSFENHAV